MYTNIFSFSERILLDIDTRDVGLSNSLARPIKLRCCVFNKVFLENHGHDILMCCCKWLCFSNCYKCIGLKPRLLFPFKVVSIRNATVQR